MKYLPKLLTPIYNLWIAGVACILGWWSGLSEMAQHLAQGALALWVLDTLLRGYRALIEKNFESRKIGRAFRKLIEYAFAVGVCVAADHTFGWGEWATVAVLGLIAYRELSSCLEHLTALGLPIKQLSERLKDWDDSVQNSKEKDKR